MAADEEGHTRSLVVRRSVVVRGHNTSVSLEDEFWRALHTIAAFRKITVEALLDEIDRHRHQPNLSSHIRMFVLQNYREQRAGPPRVPAESA